MYSILEEAQKEGIRLGFKVGFWVGGLVFSFLIVLGKLAFKAFL